MVFWIECNHCSGPGSSTQADDAYDARDWIDDHECDVEATQDYLRTLGITEGAS